MTTVQPLLLCHCTDGGERRRFFSAEIRVSMGCAPSKAEDLPLVMLCKERKQLIKSAADHRFALAAAHIAYFSELRDIGHSLCRFVEEDLLLSAASTPSSPSSLSSPVLTLPSDEGKGKGKGKGEGNAQKNDFKKRRKKKTTTGLKQVEEVQRESNSHLNLSSFSSSGNSDGSSSFRHHHSHHHHGSEHLEISEESGGGGVKEEGKVNKAPYPQPGISYIPSPTDNFYSYPSNPSYYPANNGYSNSYANPYYPAPVYPPYYSSSDFYYSGNYDNSYGSSAYTTYYMKKSSTQIPSVIYDEPKQNPIYSYSEYPPNGDYSDYPGNVRTGYFGFRMNSDARQSVGNRPPNQQRRQPPPPPSPPKVSAWDYFNPFETFEGEAYAGYYPEFRDEKGSNASSPDSREVREREGIPDLEEETESEITKDSYNEKKKVHHEKFSFPRSQKKSVQFEKVGGTNGYNGGTNKKKKNEGNFGEGTSKDVLIYSQRNEEPELPEPHAPEVVEVREVKNSSTETDISISTVEETSVKKKGVSFDEGGSSHLDIESSRPSSLTTLSGSRTRDLRDVVREIKDEFEAATDYGREVSVLLEVDKEPYRSRTTFFKVLLARVFSASLSSYHSPSTSVGGYPGATEDDVDSRSLASTLEKLYVWEKKLYKEVKDEERLRVMYEKQCERLKILDDRGAESSKIEATQALIRKLLTKINVSVRAIDSISCRIHKLRDDELQPQLKELIYGLRRMWKLLLKCHHKQFQAILGSKVRALKANTGLRRDSSVRATIQLEAALLKWCHHFHQWIELQRSYAESLNHWLKKCLHYEPEITPDGEVPYSPGRFGAPLVFITCHDWKQAMERISESKVQTAMHDFATSLHQLWEWQDEEQQQRLTAESAYKDFEKQIRALKVERQRIGHEHDSTASDKNSLSMLASETGISVLDDLKVDLDSMKQRVKEQRAGHKEAMKLVHDAVSRSIQAGLVPIFEALQSFTSEASKAFDEVRLETNWGDSW